MIIAAAAAAAITIPAVAIIPADNLSTRLHAAGCKFAVLYDSKKDATASFFILVKNTDGGFLIGSFATGI